MLRGSYSQVAAEMAAMSSQIVHVIDDVTTNCVITVLAPNSSTVGAQCEC